jgi:hypothetical protein
LIVLAYIFKQDNITPVAEMKTAHQCVSRTMEDYINFHVYQDLMESAESRRLYENQYMAFADGKLIDYGLDGEALKARVDPNLGKVSIFQGLEPDEKEPVEAKEPPNIGDYL